MAERASISQAIAIGVEATPGVPVAATKRLGSIGFQMSTETEVNAQRPNGQKYANLHVVGKEWTESDIEGAPVYTEMQYIFASLLNAPTVAPILDGATPTGAHKWTFQSNSFGEDAPRTFTVEQGSAVRAHRVSNGIISDFTLNWDREELEIEGMMLGKALEDGITLTPGAVGLDQVPIRPTEVSVYLDDDASEIGTTKLLRALSGEINLESRYAPLWVVDAAQPSFANTIEGEPELEFTLTQMADAQAMENLVRMRNGQTRFLRWQAVGPVIYSPASGDSIRHTLTIDIAGQVSEVGEFDDEDGVFAIEWTFGGVHDPAWGRAIRAELITNVGAL